MRRRKTGWRLLRFFLFFVQSTLICLGSRLRRACCKLPPPRYTAVYLGGGGMHKARRRLDPPSNAQLLCELVKKSEILPGAPAWAQKLPKGDTRSSWGAKGEKGECSCGELGFLALFGFV
jgi:hypothetical protein